jgi:hypothetical protein
MITQHRLWISIVGMTIILATMACTLLPAAPTPTTTPGLPVVVNNGGTDGSNGGSNGGGNQGNGGSNAGNSGSNNNTGGSTDNSIDATPTQLPDVNSVLYVVKQIETLGGESISGIVCSVTKPFTVLSTTPHVAFNFVFVPQNAQKGNVSYSYTIESAGESHDASGTYTLATVSKDGTLELSLAVSDHVVFHGFDGNIPNRYKFDLVPTADATCPPTP